MLHGIVHGSTDGCLHAHISRWMTDGGQVGGDGSVGGGGWVNVGMDGSFMHLAGEEEWRSPCVVCLSEDIPSRSLFCSLYLILTDMELVSQPCSRLPFLPPPPSSTSSVVCPEARSPPQCPNLSLSTKSISRHLLDAVVSPAADSDHRLWLQPAPQGLLSAGTLPAGRRLRPERKGTHFILNMDGRLA